MRAFLVASVVFGLVLLAACSAKQAPACAPLSYAENTYTLCTAPAASDLRLFLNRPSGKRLYSFEAIDAALAEDGATLVWAMNAGMYHQDRSPVGLYVEGGQTLAPLNTAARDGNFGLVPNGVFFVADGMAGVLETNAFAAADLSPTYATQSGPMLVIDGALHPAFNPDGTSAKKRNGIGLSADGETIYALISDGPVTFHAFASVFADHLETPNALFLDGTVSRVYYPAESRSDPGLAMGPMVGLVATP